MQNNLKKNIYMHTEWIESQKDKYDDIAYMWNIKKDTNELIYKTEIELQM